MPTLLDHPLEHRFNATAWDILSAIENGFRAQVDAKGKLAEWFLHKGLLTLKDAGVIEEVHWRDADGLPDFPIKVCGQTLELECKNVRSGNAVFTDGYKVEVQKMRSSIGGGPSRGYRADEFDILAACLFNQTGEWTYRFCATNRLARRLDHPDYLVVMHRVPVLAEGCWRDRLQDAIDDALEG